MAKGKKTGFFKRILSDALPFVAKSPEMKVGWLVSELRQERLTCVEIAPYISLMLMDYQNLSSLTFVEDGDVDLYEKLFEKLEKKVLRKIIRCADVYDVPALLELVPELDVDDAVAILTKSPPPYERKPRLVVEKLFQAVYESSSEELLDEAAGSIINRGTMPEHFEESYLRFKEIREDEKVLSALYPQAVGHVRIE